MEKKKGLISPGLPEKMYLRLRCDRGALARRLQPLRPVCSLRPPRVSTHTRGFDPEAISMQSHEAIASAELSRRPPALPGPDPRPHPPQTPLCRPGLETIRRRRSVGVWSVRSLRGGAPERPWGRGSVGVGRREVGLDGVCMAEHGGSVRGTI